jgi:UDP-3-O-[3-hydroxymyristoyl] glucosamine N-acyltransferase
MNAREIADLVGGELRGDGEVEIKSVSDLRTATAGQIAFFDKPDAMPETGASCVLLKAGATDPATQVASIVEVSNPKLAFAQVASRLVVRDSRKGWHETAVMPPQSPDIRARFIGANVSIGEGTAILEESFIHDGVRIGRNVVIGKSVTIHSNCVLYDSVKIGDGVVLHAGVVVGADGFGYVKDESGSYQKFPQIGTVVIEDDVEIGANSCVDRGALGETRIGEGTKIDNLVQVGHNVQIGKRCVIAAQTGISGSTVIEDDCVIGGQVGFGDHARVQSGSVIGSQAGVLPGKIVRPGVWWGTPIQPLDEFKRQNAHIKSLGRLKDEVRELKRRLDSKS